MRSAGFRKQVLPATLASTPSLRRVRTRACARVKMSPIGETPRGHEYVRARARGSGSSCSQIEALRAVHSRSASYRHSAPALVPWLYLRCKRPDAFVSDGLRCVCSLHQSLVGTPPHTLGFRRERQHQIRVLRSGEPGADTLELAQCPFVPLLSLALVRQVIGAPAPELPAAQRQAELGNAPTGARALERSRRRSAPPEADRRRYGPASAASLSTSPPDRPASPPVASAIRAILQTPNQHMGSESVDFVNRLLTEERDPAQSPRQICGRTVSRLCVAGFRPPTRALMRS